MWCLGEAPKGAGLCCNKLSLHRQSWGRIAGLPRSCWRGGKSPMPREKVVACWIGGAAGGERERMVGAVGKRESTAQ